MTDEDMTKLCAEAMGFTLYARGNGRDLEIHHANGSSTIYDPLHDDAQAMALVKKFPMECSTAIEDWGNKQIGGDLNRAIMEAVAELQTVDQLVQRKESP